MGEIYESDLLYGVLRTLGEIYAKELKIDSDIDFVKGFYSGFEIGKNESNKKNDFEDLILESIKIDNREFDFNGDAYYLGAEKGYEITKSIIENIRQYK